jgi:hypothetical protein
MDSNTARLFEVGVEAGLGGADVGACVVESEGTGTVELRQVVESDGDDGCCLPGRIHY